MRSVNKVTLMGYVGQDPSIVVTGSGAVIANFSLATSYRRTSPDGSSEKYGDEVTEWHRLVAFKRTAEIIRDYVKKGAPLYVEGQLQTRSWEKDGEKRYTTEIVIRELSMLGTAPAGAAAALAAQGGIAGEEAAARANAEISDDDIPFSM